MNAESPSFSTANKIRTKLLLFIDQEIQLKIKQNKLKNNFQKYDKTKFCKSHTKTYSYQPNIIFMNSINSYDFSNSKNEQKYKDSKHSFSTCEITPSDKNILAQFVENSDNVHYLPDHKKTSCYNIISFRQKCYLIKKGFKPSSTFQIYQKPKTDKKYLNNLCDKLKIPSKKTFYSKINYKTFVKRTKIGDSSPIKKINRKNEKNPRF